MFAIVEIKGKQYKVQPGTYVYVDYMREKEIGEEVEFNDVLLLNKEDGETLIGKPVLENVKVKTKVLAHVKGDKIIVFKKKRRKGYKVKKGHRQKYTKLQIEEIII